MPSELKDNATCPKCKRKITLVLRQWSIFKDQVEFEYQHEEDWRGRKGRNCKVKLRYIDGVELERKEVKHG